MRSAGPVDGANPPGTAGIVLSRRAGFKAKGRGTGPDPGSNDLLPAEAAAGRNRTRGPPQIRACRAPGSGA